MLTLRAASHLLATADSLDALANLVATLGCEEAPAPLDAATRAALGIPDDVRDVRIARGPGTLRALLIEVSATATLREVLTRLAARLASRAPHLLWMVAGLHRPSAQVALASWSAERVPPRLAALLWDREHVVDSDAETLCALAAAGEGPDVMVHARWLELLGRESLTRRFYRALERTVHSMAEQATGRATLDERREVALLHVSRLLFLSFLEAKGWLDGDHGFLSRRFDACMEQGGDYQRRVLHPLFFGTLNTPLRQRAPAALALGRVPFLNGGLFSRTPLERRLATLRFADAQLALVHADLLARYRFSAREESADWSEAAIDPEMLGKAFESLMSSTDRRSSGSFYTPQAIVERVTAAALDDALAGDDAQISRARIGRLRILDPACGSGAFLVHALERLAAILRELGDDRPVAEVRRTVLTRSIFGVDVNPTAVWLCELRLWLSVVIESDVSDPLSVPPLPNLDHHVRLGDALAGRVVATTAARRLGALRERYARASGARKVRLAGALDREERRCALAAAAAELARITSVRREIVCAQRSPNLFGERHGPDASTRAHLQSLRREARQLRTSMARLSAGGALPFSFASHFADVAADGGFDVIVGNPPWVRLRNIPPRLRAELRASYAVFRQAAWVQGAEDAAAGSGFGAQVDLSALFVERSLALLRPRGTLALLLPVKLWRSLAGGGVRRMLARDARVVALEDWSESPAAFDAAVYPSLLVARRDPDGDTPVSAAVHRRSGALQWTIAHDRLTLDDSPGSPWILAPSEVRAGFDRLARAGIPLHASALGRPTLGVKCGCNDAFIVELRDGDHERAIIGNGERERPIERCMLRPLVRGETLEPWIAHRHARAAEWIVWTHGDDGRPVERLPPLVERWLAPWKLRLAARSDARGARRWWMLFRTESAACDRPRVVWCDFGRTPRAAILPEGDPTVPLNSCYVVSCNEVEDAEALTALLQSPVAAAWLALLAEPARGGWRRYLGWTMARLPIPRDWDRARAMLAPLARRARRGEPPSPQELIEMATRSYRVRLSDIEALLTWNGR